MPSGVVGVALESGDLSDRVMSDRNCCRIRAAKGDFEPFLERPPSLIEPVAHEGHVPGRLEESP